MDEILDKLGFGEYNDGAGDYGERRLYKDGKIICKVIIMDMVKDYWTNELPEYEYYFSDENTHEPIENEGDLLKLIREK